MTLTIQPQIWRESQEQVEPGSTPLVIEGTPRTDLVPLQCECDCLVTRRARYTMTLCYATRDLAHSPLGCSTIGLLPPRLSVIQDANKREPCAPFQEVGLFTSGSKKWRASAENLSRCQKPHHATSWHSRHSWRLLFLKDAGIRVADANRRDFPES